MKTGIDLIAAERRRQIMEEGWTPEHDAEHVNGELALAAACYTSGDFGNWPWDPQWLKPKDRVRDLVRAGALIAAELDRLAKNQGDQPAAPEHSWVSSGISVPAAHTDSRGAFYGNRCYLDGLVSLLARNTSWHPVAVHVRADEILVECQGWAGFNHRDLAYLAEYFKLPVGWAVKGWDCHPTSRDSSRQRRSMTLFLWLDKPKALAGQSGEQVSESTRFYLEEGRRAMKSSRSG